MDPDTTGFMPLAFTIAICLGAFIVIFFSEIQEKILNILSLKGMRLLLPLFVFSYLLVYQKSLMSISFKIIKIILDQLIFYMYQLFAFNIIAQYIGMTIMLVAFMQLGLYVIVYIFEDLDYSDYIEIYPYQVLNAVFWITIHLI